MTKKFLTTLNWKTRHWYWMHYIRLVHHDNQDARDYICHNHMEKPSVISLKDDKKNSSHPKLEDGYYMVVKSHYLLSLPQQFCYAQLLKIYFGLKLFCVLKVFCPFLHYDYNFWAHIALLLSYCCQCFLFGCHSAWNALQWQPPFLHRIVFKFSF